MKNRLIFPLFNALVCASFGALIGYYISRSALSILLGGLGGLWLGLLVELLLGRLGLTHWLYRRRVLLATIIEMLVATFVVGPYAYVIVETQADPLSRTFSMEIRIANRDEKLRPGMIANVTVPYEKIGGVILIPLDAVIGFGSQPSVFVVRKSIAGRRMIQTGEITGEHVEVLQGLNPGETVVVSGQEYLNSGNRVLLSKSIPKLAELQ